MKTPIAVLQDLQGPRIRLGRLEGGHTQLEVGAEFHIVADPVVGNQERVSTTYPQLVEDVKLGETILIRDGSVRLRCTDKMRGTIETIVEIGGEITDKAGLNLPDTHLQLAAITEKDIADIRWGLDHGVDYLALSFVSSVLDIHQLLSHLPDDPSRPLVIAKVERPRAVEIIDELLQAADGVMVARGDLGVELARERVPIVQKEIIRKANERGKIVITATQMLESMRFSPAPTRAEASDVANAILDGSDAVMLSGETAAGEYPVEAVEMMDRIIHYVEQSDLYGGRPYPDFVPLLAGFANAVATAATAASDVLDVKAICALTTTGRTAALLRSHRPEQEIIAFTPSERAYNRMALYWGVLPALVEECRDIASYIGAVEQTLRERGLGEEGEAVVLVMGVPLGTGAETNLIKLHRLGAPHEGTL